MTVSATERVTASLVLSGAIGWSFVPVLQLLTGLLLVRRPKRDRLELLARYFGTHWPWSLWILAAQATLLLVPITRHFGQWITITATVPMLWTVFLLLRFCREELQLERRECWWRVAIHQSTTYAIALAYVSVAVSLRPRVVGLFG